MRVRAERAFTDLQAETYRATGDVWEADDTRASDLATLGLVSVLSDETPAPKRSRRSAKAQNGK